MNYNPFEHIAEGKPKISPHDIPDDILDRAKSTKELQKEIDLLILAGKIETTFGEY